MKEDPKKITVKDSIGREVSVPVNVEQVVDFAVMDGTRAMVLLGAEDKLVGVNDRITFSNFSMFSNGVTENMIGEIKWEG